MDPRLNILSLHRLGTPRLRREAVRALEYMMPRYARDQNCIVHDANLPAPDYLRRIDFHAILLGPTFLCSRYDPGLYARTLEQFDFIRESGAFKIALPQDEYDCSAVLDCWLIHWNVDQVYSVIPDQWEVLFPEYSKRGCIKLGYTGYIAEEWVENWKTPKAPARRELDVCYRASRLPAHFGSIGKLKSEIAERFVRKAAGMPLRLDISTRPEDVIPGESWHAFLENARFCLTTPSGSSVLDPEGEIRRKVRRYAARYPGADFEEIAQACFPGEDRARVFTAISPRNIEAAVAETVQIGTPGCYSGIMQPMQHYLPLDEDCGNFPELVAMMDDHGLVERIRRDCKEAMLSHRRLHFRHFVAEVLDLVREAVSARGISGSPQAQVTACLRRYAEEFEPKVARYWRNRDRVSGLKAVVDRLGGRRIREYLQAAG